jgi:pimeloyl-ACP methyl ester carboxylesterase
MARRYASTRLFHALLLSVGVAAAASQRTATDPPVGAPHPAVAATGQEPAPAAPSAKECADLIEEFAALAETDAAGRARRDAIAARLDAVVLADPKALAKWRRELEKVWQDGPTVEKKSGRHHLWPDEERGLYIVGGRTKGAKGLVIGMHGGGAGSGDAGSAQGILEDACADLGLLAIFPEVLEKTEHGWTDSGTEEFVLELVERALRTFEIDPDRVFFVGHSMGGYGSWTLGGHHADRVAAIAPTAGAPTPILDLSGAYVDVIEGVIPNLRNVPVRVYQSDDDPNVPPAANDIAVAKLREARERFGGYDFEYWRVSGRGHDLPPGGMRAMLDTIVDFEREPRPQTVLWQPTLTWKRQFHWLWWQEPRLLSLVEARLDREANRVSVLGHGLAREALAGLYVLVDDELLDLEREIVVELDGVETFRGRVQPTLGVLVQTGASGDAGRTFVARVPVAP